MTLREDDKWDALAPARLLIIFCVAGFTSAATVGLVAAIATWWILVFSVVYFLCAGAVVFVAIANEMDRDERSQTEVAETSSSGGSSSSKNQLRSAKAGSRTTREGRAARRPGPYRSRSREPLRGRVRVGQGSDPKGYSHR
jgi:hypothetical protein